VLKGKTYIAPDIAGDLVQAYRTGKTDQNRLNGKLTERQKEIIQLIAEGYSTKEIADTLCISVRTVENHKYNMKQELNLKTTADLVKYAIKEGIVTI
jgi:DNA-binding NarL/FixJ family response regulator